MEVFFRSALLLLLGMFLVSFAADAAPQRAPRDVNDEYLRGYATAIVTLNFPMSARALHVEQGVIYIENIALSNEDKIRLQQLLDASGGGIRLELVDPSDVAVYTRSPPLQKISKKEALPAFLPSNTRFQPLIADPRWPHFSASYQHYFGDRELGNVGATSFGESISLYRFPGPWGSTMEVGIQAGVFSIFDLDAESYDLINADYTVGVPLSFKKGSALLFGMIVPVTNPPGTWPPLPFFQKDGPVAAGPSNPTTKRIAQFRKKQQMIDT